MTRRILIMREKKRREKKRRWKKIVVRCETEGKEEEGW